MNQSEHFLWVERYRPKKIEDCILPQDLKDTFQDFVNKGELPNMLLCGSAGTGKTTIARALCEELGCDYIIINSSLENGIDTLRTKIANFCSTVSFSGGTKVVILDEFDYANCIGGDQKIMVIESGELKELPVSALVGKELELPSVSQHGNLVIDTGYVIETGEKELFEVLFEDGSVIFCTSDHKFFDSNMNEVTIDEFDYLKYINIEDMNKLVNI